MPSVYNKLNQVRELFKKYAYCHAYQTTTKEPAGGIYSLLNASVEMERRQIP